MLAKNATIPKFKQTGARSRNKWPCVCWVWNHMIIIFLLLMELNEDCHTCKSIFHINKVQLSQIHYNAYFCVGYSRNSCMLSPSLCPVFFKGTYLPERLSTPTLSIRSIVTALILHAVKNFHWKGLPFHLKPLWTAYIFNKIQCKIIYAFMQLTIWWIMWKFCLGIAHCPDKKRGGGTPLISIFIY
jgi:hypothetical protein